MNDIQVIEQNGQRVLTTQQLAEKYETDPRTISNNFNRNLDRYKDGEHYFVLEGETKRAFCDHHQFDDGSKKASQLYLWTEKGCLLHAKSLNTDKAWEVYSILVDTYFRAKEASALSELEALAKVVNGMVLQERQLREVERAQLRLVSKVEQLENKMEKRLTDDYNLQLVTPTQIGKMFEPAISGKEVNERLRKAGLQWRVGGEWVAAVPGRQYSLYEPVQLESGKIISQLKWQRRVKELI